MLDVNDFFDRLFFEQTLIPIALYQQDENAAEGDASAIRYIDANEAYERVNKVKRKNIVGKSFAEVWPNVEYCWSDIILRCIKEKHAVHCESESKVTHKYLEAIAFPLSDRRVATVFLDRTVLKKSEMELRDKEKQLISYRNMLRELATKLTLSEESTRREIANDIHDRIGHALLTQLLNLRKLKESGELPKEASAIIDTTITETEQMITESRELIFELSPPILLEVGLTPALEALADNLLTPCSIKWYVTARGGADQYSAEDAVCVILYRMTRELLVNVIKHAKATTVYINVNRGPGHIQVVVEDDGIGMSPRKHSKNGLGIFSIRERLLHIGGEMQMISNKDGTTVSLMAPLKIGGHR